MSTVVQNDIYQRVFGADRPRLNVSAARSILALGFPDEDVERMNELSAKARAGKLSKAEDAELDEYVRVGFMLGILQSKARRALKRGPAKS